MTHRALCLALAVAVLSPGLSAAEEQATALRDLSLEELVRVPVTSASRWEETLAGAPATMIVLDRDDLEERGYSDLSEILDDLPGTDTARPYGATWFNSYWRGFRSDIGSPFLLLLDGMELNHLYFRTAHVLSAIPVTAVERVEVLYGPASSVYGANAFMGVLHVMTRRAPAAGARGQLRGEIGDRDVAVGDGWAAGRAGGWGFRVAGRWDESDLDTDGMDRYAYTDPALYGDPRLWGGFADAGRLGGDFSSPWRNRGFDLRLERGRLEIGATFLETSSGYGVEYAADRAQTRAVWRRPSLGLHLRWTQRLTPRLDSTTLLRYREDDVDPESYFVEAFEVEGVEGDPRRVDFSLWESDNQELALLQDFALDLREDLELSLGFQVRERDLQKAYGTAFGPALPPSEIDLATYPFPSPGDQTEPAANRIDTTEIGLYLQSRWQLTPRQRLHGGVRWDDHSDYGSETTLRGGWVGDFGGWVAKVLYGEAYQEPNPRVLYGGWRGSGNDPDLRPERSHTVETSVGRAGPRHRALVAGWHVENRDLILTSGQVQDPEGTVQDSGGARNAGDQRVTGADLMGEILVDSPWLDRTRIWASWSHLFAAEEELPSAGGYRSRPIGDLAEDQVRLGLTVRRGALTGTLLARWIGERRTVATNPVGIVDDYAVADLYVRWKGSGSYPWTVGLRARNLFDSAYEHPGVREASSGDVPGSFDDSGVWHGSGGFFNSLLPQPGRTLSLVIGFERP
jgi:outer membrane receptor protein involved in Fe transport